LFSELPAIDPTGLLTFAPVAGQAGIAEVNIVLSDNEGASSEAQTVIINIEGSNAKLVLYDSNGNGISGAIAQYNDNGDWVDLPAQTDANGEILLEGLSGKVKLPVNHNNTYKTITQNLDKAKTALFQTIHVTTKLIDSGSNPLDGGVVEFNRSGWQPFGTTSNGTANLEMLPGNYSFRITYANGRQTLSRNIVTNPTITFQTKLVTVELNDSTDSPIASLSNVTYRGVEWKTLGTLSSGSVSLELLPASYSFRVAHLGATAEKSQNIKTDVNIEFKTKNVTVELRNSSGELIKDATARYEFHSGAWNDLGVTDQGEMSVELLPKTYRFRVEHKSAKKEQSKNTQFTSTITFKTMNIDTELRNSESNLIADDNGSVKFYSGGWNEIGETSDGTASIELFPNFYNFRMPIPTHLLNKRMS
jgi:hypothetical protein